MMSIPIALSAFTHLWNPTGFPSIYTDEGVYFKRALLVLDGVGPQDPSFGLYDHPYFGQLFIAGVLKLIGYPASISNLPSFFSSINTTAFSPTASSTRNSIQDSIEMLYFVPRVLMGILAVADTFLIYKICERRYDRYVALIASVLFAVMPITWYTRWILLDSIQLPFLLSSILFAVYYYGNSNNNNNNAKTSNNKEIITILLSGIFLGLAIFTKIPAFTMIPLVGFLLVYTRTRNGSENNSRGSLDIIRSRRRLLSPFQFTKKNVKMVGLWLIPVILIPSIWPAYAMFIGQFSKWIDGLYFQTHRNAFRLKFNAPSFTLLDALEAFFKSDPVLLILGTIGLAFSVVVKRDSMILLWSVPFLTFLYFIGFVLPFYVIPLLPVFCIATAVMISDLSNKASRKIINHRIIGYFSTVDSSLKNMPLIIKNNSAKNIFLSFIVVSAIGILGLIGITALITTNLNSPYFKANAFVALYTSGYDSSAYSPKGNLTIISDPLLLLAPQSLLHKDYYYKDYLNTNPIRAQNILLVLNYDDYKHWVSRNNFVLIRQMQRIYENTFPTAMFKADIAGIYDSKYPLASAPEDPNRQIEIRTNFLQLNSSAHVVQTSNGTVAKVNDRLYKVALANLPRSLSPDWWRNSNSKNSIKTCGPLFKCMANSTTGWKDNDSYNNNNYNNNSSLQISTNTSNKNTWSWIYGNEIKVNPGEKYIFITHMKLNEFASKSHIAIKGYNEASKNGYHIIHCPSGVNGPLEWKEYSCTLTIPKDITKIRPILNAGWSSQPGKEAITLFDAISLSKLNTKKRDDLKLKPDFVQYFDKSYDISNSCQFGRNFDVHISYKLIESQIHNGNTLNLVANCSRL